jgi:acyl-CoA oxidase
MTFLRTYLDPSTSSNASSHRSSLFAQNVTPRAFDLIQAIGHRIAYDSAQDDSSIRREFLNIWEADCMLENAGWYVEHAGLTNAELHSRRVEAMECALPHLEAVIGEWGMEKWFGNVPIASEIAEEEFLRGLPTFEGGGMEGMLSRM